MYFNTFRMLRYGRTQTAFARYEKFTSAELLAPRRPGSATAYSIGATSPQSAASHLPLKLEVMSIGMPPSAIPLNCMAPV